jgi:ABC-2 type transport system ATP-binding protein
LPGVRLGVDFMVESARHWDSGSGMPIISAENLRKQYTVAAKEPGVLNTLRHFFHRRYRTIDAVKGISFTIEPGEVVGFLGPNGAGKTTTLKMLTGLMHPTSGSVRVAGHVPFKRQHGFLNRITLVMGQKQQLIWDLPALESLKINAAVYDISPADFTRRVGEFSEMLNIHEQLRQPVRKLSLGERMKAELMAALLHHPDVLFLDEPTLGLDVNAQSAVRQFLRDYNRQYQATILLTSHYMADITALCRRVALIHHGDLIYDGTLDEIIERFAPFREVRLEFEQPVAAEQLGSYGQVEEVNGRSARILVRRDALTTTIAQLLSRQTVLDLTITDPPIEDIIGKLFAKGSMA